MLTLSSTLTQIVIFAVFTSVVLAQDPTICLTEGQACEFYLNAQLTPGFCNAVLSCGDIGSSCSSDVQCSASATTPNPCGNGVCGGRGATCAYQGQCTADQFCAYTIMECQYVCPDGSAPNLNDPNGMFCPCLSASQVYDQGTNTCGCAAEYFSNPELGPDVCTQCPASSYSPPASTVCQCSAGQTPEIFSVVDGVPSCCPAEGAPSPNPLSGGDLCTCNNPQQTFNPVSVACDCPANTYGVFPSYGIKNCPACPANSHSDPGSTICTCDPTYVTEVDFEGLNCNECPPTGYYNSNTQQCGCMVPTEYYNLATNECLSCPTGVIHTSDSLTCICGVNEYFSDGQCYCSRGPNLSDCDCAGDSTSTIIGDSAYCVCQAPEAYTDGEGCYACPQFATYYPDDTGGTCQCDDPNASLSHHQCVCNGFPGPQYLDPTGTCQVCGDGTNPRVLSGGSTCTCLLRAQKFDPVLNECYTPTAPSTRGKRSSKRQKLELQMLLQGDWRQLSNDLLCPDGLQACPVLPTMVSYECLDTMMELDSCGGCASLGEGIDCLSLPGVNSATCSSGICQIYSCLPGWTAQEVLGKLVCQRA